MSQDLEGSFQHFAEQPLPWIIDANDMLDAVDVKRAELRAQAIAEARANSRRKR